MSQSSIRLVRTPDVDKVISYLRNRYNLLSEAEIIKLALSEKYQKEKDVAMEKNQEFRKAFYHAIEEGNKIGDRMIRKKGLDPKKITEQQFYDLFLNDHNH